MIKAEKLSYSFPQKDLYNKISFTLEDDVHCAFIGTNGTGKSTLVDMILHPDNYLYDGRLIVDVPGRIGYVSQFYSLDEEKEVTVPVKKRAFTIVTESGERKAAKGRFALYAGCSQPDERSVELTGKRPVRMEYMR